MSAIKENLKSIKSNIKEYSNNVNRDSEDVTLIAVTKTSLPFLLAENESHPNQSDGNRSYGNTADCKSKAKHLGIYNKTEHQIIYAY